MALVRHGHEFGPDNLLLDFAGEDHDLLALLASFALEDVEDLQAAQKGKGRTHAPPSDAELALRLYAEEAEALAAFAKDAAFARSFDSALTADAPALASHMREELHAQYDHDVALAISQGQPPPPPPAAITSGAILRRLAIQPPPPPATPNQRPVTKVLDDSYVRPGERLTCTSCTDRITTRVARGPCDRKHPYCFDCVKELFTLATTDESLYPPRCCQAPFVVTAVASILGSALLATFNKKAQEFGTANRVYCHLKTCSEFLGPATEMRGSLACGKCMSRTCSRCKAATHHMFVPCKEAQDEEVLALGEQQGWKRCPACHTLIELAHGCYHMTCRCRKEFCYLCAATWKTCACTQWDEDRLIVAAEERVQRQAPAPVLVPAAAAPVRNPFQDMLAQARRQALIRQEADRLRVNHDCTHGRWTYIRGGHSCEHCGHYLREYIFRCDGCMTFACNRCRRNRL